MRPSVQERDHPRRCGENMQGSCADAFGRGSPPQVRGKQISCKHDSAKYRITPAGAGKTDAPAQVALENEDHPRRCGENWLGMRQFNERDRITPAGAGKTMPAPISQGLRKDHPRRCGENLTISPQSSASAGSPPQVRGKHRTIYCRKRQRRITPAGAGKTGKMA